jgi:hypothetical protein
LYDKGHIHDYTGGTGDSWTYIPRVNGGYNQATISTKTATADLDSTDEETRPMNYTIKIWKRTA